MLMYEFKSKPNSANTLHAYIPVAKPSHMAKDEGNAGGKYTLSQRTEEMNICSVKLQLNYDISILSF